MIDYGALGIMVIFLAWQHLQLTKRQREDGKSAADRSDRVMEKFESQLNDIHKKYETREDQLRLRYDTVISDLNLNRDTLKNEIHVGIIATTDKIDSLTLKVNEGLIEIKDMKQQDMLRRAQRDAQS
tara:strand:- start:9694 stop:10074 length:381 start_codon:yes stop_codon:yes gene_type:complete